MISETSEFPGKNGKILISHIEKKISPKEPVKTELAKTDFHPPLIFGFGKLIDLDE